MRIGVYGLGGVGGLLAGLLARAGHDVSVVARGEALARVRDHGLHVESPLGTFDARLDAAESPETLRPVDAVLLAVKTWQVPAAAAAIAPWLAPGGFVVPLENGVDAPDQCAAVLGDDRVLGGLCRMLSAAVEPGVVRHVGDAPSVTLGAWRTPLAGRDVEVGRALEAAGARVEVAADFRRALWEKLLFIASFGGVGALARATAGALRTIPETRALLAAACEEVSAVAAAKGIALAPDVVARTLAAVDSLPAEGTASLQRDVVAGRPSELDALSGAVVRHAAPHAVPVPVHTTIHAALQPLEHAARTNPAARRG
jgi:2-dehydropantoate 2-reductase